MTMEDEFEDDAPPPDETDTDGDDEFDATEPCPYCNKLIHEDAEICHHCGKFVDRENPTVRPPWISIAVIALLAAMVLFWLL